MVKNTEENDHEQLDVKWDHNAELAHFDQTSFVTYTVAYSDFFKLFLIKITRHKLFLATEPISV